MKREKIGTYVKAGVIDKYIETLLSVQQQQINSMRLILLP